METAASSGIATGSHRPTTATPDRQEPGGSHDPPCMRARRARARDGSSTDLDVVELGCGTGYVSAWLARRGGRCVGLDNSAKQLETARMLQRESAPARIRPVVPARACRRRASPVRGRQFRPRDLRVRGGDLVRPLPVDPEAARLLRPDGRLVFLCYSNLVMLCMRERVGGRDGGLFAISSGCTGSNGKTKTGSSSRSLTARCFALVRRWVGGSKIGIWCDMGSGAAPRASDRGLDARRVGYSSPDWARGGRAKRSGRLGRSDSRHRMAPRVQPSAGGSIAARTKVITSRSRRFSEARPLSAPTTTFRTLASVSEPTTPV